MSATSLLVPMRFIFLISNILLIVEIIQQLGLHAEASLDPGFTPEQVKSQFFIEKWFFFFKKTEQEKTGTILLSVMLGFIAVEIGGLMSGLTFLSGFQQSFSSGKFQNISFQNKNFKFF